MSTPELRRRGHSGASSPTPCPSPTTTATRASPCTDGCSAVRQTPMKARHLEPSATSFRDSFTRGWAKRPTLPTTPSATCRRRQRLRPGLADTVRPEAGGRRLLRRVRDRERCRWARPGNRVRSGPRRSTAPGARSTRSRRWRRSRASRRCLPSKRCGASRGRAGEPLGSWLKNTAAIYRLTGALKAAWVIALSVPSAPVDGVEPRPVTPRRAGAPADGIVRGFCLRRLNRLNEDVPVRVVVQPASGAARRRAGRGGIPPRGARPAARRAVFADIAGSEAFLRAVAEEPLEDCAPARLRRLARRPRPRRPRRVHSDSMSASRTAATFHPLAGGCGHLDEKLLKANAAAWTAGARLPPRTSPGLGSFQRQG